MPQPIFCVRYLIIIALTTMFRQCKKMSFRIRQSRLIFQNAKRFNHSTRDIRKMFVDFFEKRGHTHVPSASVVPDNDPTLLFTNAGMNQFKSKILGIEDGCFPGINKAVSYQRCIRAGGKHNDLEETGKDVHHHTFFEMLGNWSFDNAYDKRQACEYAWELLTSVYENSPDRLYVTYFGGDAELGVKPDLECRDVWRRIGVPYNRILPFVKENFWEMGAVGPCGPCTEIHFDRVPGRSDASALVNLDNSVVEIWNLVFMSYLRDQSGLRSLSSQHIDTGMGLERLTSIIQGTTSNYETDAFRPILKHIKQLSRVPAYGGSISSPIDVAYRIVADHVRAVTVALAEGAQPAGDGAGFVVRKILRRAIANAVNILQMERGALAELIPTVVDTLADAHQHLQTQCDFVMHTVIMEESQYWKTLDKGKKHFIGVIANLPDEQNVIPGKEAWTLLDTHGIPLEMTEQWAQSMGISVDALGFKEQRELARNASKASSSLGTTISVSVKEFPTYTENYKYDYGWNEEMKQYEFPARPSRVLCLFDKSLNKVERLQNGEEGFIILEEGIFYGEEGGQKGDSGALLGKDGQTILVVKDCVKMNGLTLLKGVSELALSEGETVEQHLDKRRRRSLMMAHTSTHLLNWALQRTGVGEGQKGSSVGEESLRFDYASGELSGEEDSISMVEELTGSVIAKRLPFTVQEMKLEEARKLRSLQSQFREDKEYPVVVRVAYAGSSLEEGIAVECCSGTHVLNTAHIGDVAILSDKSIAKGTRRIVAVCGEQARNARLYGAQVLGKLRELRNNGFDARSLEQFRKSIDFGRLPYGDNQTINKRLREMKKTLKDTKRVLAVRE